MEKLQIIDVKLIEDNDRVKLYHIEYLDKKGNKKNWSISSRNTLEELKDEIFNKNLNADGVAIYSIHKETNCLVLLKEFRISINDYLYTIPGGMINKNESIETAAKREFQEETGLQLDTILDISDPLYSAVGITNEKVILVTGECSGQITKANQSSSEDAEILLVDVNLAKQILKTGKLAAKTYLLIQMFINKYEKTINSEE